MNSSIRKKEWLNFLKAVPKKKQTILFSATLNDKVEEIKSTLDINPIVIEIKKQEVDLEQIEQIAYKVEAENKGPFLRYLIKSENLEQVLVFVSSTRTADNLVDKLKKNKISAMAIHSKKSQGARMDNLEDFKLGDVKVLVATDLIGRGIHIEGLPTVINYELPRSPLDYVHRIGRTGRANANGKAISLITEEDLHHFKIIQKKMGKKVEVLSIDDVNLHGF